VTVDQYLSVLLAKKRKVPQNYDAQVRKGGGEVGSESEIRVDFLENKHKGGEGRPAAGLVSQDRHSCYSPMQS